MGVRLALAMALAPVVAAGAQEADSLWLREVVVEGARVVSRAGGVAIYPAQWQKEASASLYAVLARAGLNGIRVDEVGNTITPLDNRGGVELRINGVKASAYDLLQVAPTDLLRIEYTDSPGVRHGREVGRVVNFIVRLPVAGYGAGARLSNAVTAAVGRNSVYARASRGTSQVSVDYGMGYTRFDGARTEETARYLMPGNTLRTIVRSDADGLMTALSHSVGLAYSMRRDSVLAFQARLRTDIERTPHNDSRRDYSYDEGSPYAYHLHGRSYRLDAEAVAESRPGPLVVTAGMVCSQHYDAIDYGGDVDAADRSRVSDIYGFAQLKGSLWRVDYVAGIGLSTYYFRRNASAHRFTLLRPKLTVQCPLPFRLKLSYDIELSEYMSRMAATGSAVVRVNSMEAEAGNPGLRPYRRVEQSLRLSYDGVRLSASLQGSLRVNHDCNMERYSRHADAAGNAVFVKTQVNDGHCSMLSVLGYCRADIIERRLSVAANGGVYRFINIGADYRHFYTAFNGGVSLAAHFGKLTLTAAADNGWRFMEGERRGQQGGSVSMTASCRLGRFTLAAYWQNPFRNTIMSERTELVNRFVGKSTTRRNGNLGNLLGISVSWTMGNEQNER